MTCLAFAMTTVVGDVPVITDLSAIAAGEVSVDPENLRFQYEMMEEGEPAPTKTSKRQKPVVYREQVMRYNLLLSPTLTIYIILHTCHSPIPLNLSLSLSLFPLSYFVGPFPSHSQCGKNNAKCHPKERQGCLH